MKLRKKRKASARLANRTEDYKRTEAGANAETKAQMHPPGSRNPRKGGGGPSKRKNRK